MKAALLAAALVAVTASAMAAQPAFILPIAPQPSLGSYTMTASVWHNPKDTWDICYDYQMHGKPMILTVKVNGHVIKARGEVCIKLPNEPKGLTR